MGACWSPKRPRKPEEGGPNGEAEAEEGTVPRRVLEDARHADGDDPHGDDTVIHAEEDYVRPRYSSRLAD